jgi:hypothetical protein
MRPALLLLAGCFAHKAHVSDTLEGRYVPGTPKDPAWKVEDPGGADHAWWNAALGSTLYTDSNCGIRFEDVPLPMLVNRLLAGITDRKDVDQRDLTVAGRGALYRARKGTLDGAPIEVGAVVLKKDSCTFDFVLITRPEAYEAALPALWEVIEGFSQGAP